MLDQDGYFCGIKCEAYRAAMQVPLNIRYPARFKARRITRALVDVGVDMMLTLLDPLTLRWPDGVEFTVYPHSEGMDELLDHSLPRASVHMPDGVEVPPPFVPGEVYDCRVCRRDFRQGRQGLARTWCSTASRGVGRCGWRRISVRCARCARCVNRTRRPSGVQRPSVGAGKKPVARACQTIPGARSHDSASVVAAATIDFGHLARGRRARSLSAAGSPLSLWP